MASEEEEELPAEQRLRCRAPPADSDAEIQLRSEPVKGVLAKQVQLRGTEERASHLSVYLHHAFLPLSEME